MSAPTFKEIDSHGITDVPGFKASGVHCDVRQKGNDQLDLGIIFSETPCSVAGTFTRNRIKAAPVLKCMELLDGDDPIHGVVANSGNANACTGVEGLANAAAMTEQAEEHLSGQGGKLLVCSTGRIGRQLPMKEVRKGVELAVDHLTDDSTGGEKFAKCILTSDTREKKITVAVESESGDSVTLAGVAKGAGMIRPDMATMLAFIATDLKISQVDLQTELGLAVKTSFNAITVDGDMSTNDTVLCFANGVGSVNWNSASGSFKEAFREALDLVCKRLAKLIVGDGEKITKVVTLKIDHAESENSALEVAYAIAHSPLVKSSWAGSDPNWGRVVAAAGYSGVPVVENDLRMFYDDVLVFEKGLPVDVNLPTWQTVVDQKEFAIRLDLGMGEASAELIASDLTPEYINFNMKE